MATTIAEADVVQAVSDYSGFSIQTKAQHDSNPPTNTDADILYASSGRLQGNFTSFYVVAADVLDRDLARLGKSMTDAEKIRAYAYLIADLQAQKVPDWAAKQISYGGDSVTRDGNKTSYRISYEQFLASITKPTRLPAPYSYTAQTVAADTSNLAVKPAFRRGMTDNVGSGSGFDPADREHFQP